MDNPTSIVQATNDVNDSAYEKSASLYYLIDWKMNDGNWNVCLSPDNPNFNDEVHGYFYGNMPNVQIDKKGNSNSFFVSWHLDPTKGPSDDFDLKNNTYYFRMRYVMEPYDGDFETIYSPYSDVFAIGKVANATKITKLDQPTNLKVEVKKDSNNKPYFHLNWTIAASITEASKQIPV